MAAVSHVPAANPTTKPPSILAVAGAEPLDPMTWSGSSRGLLTALERRGALIGAVGARPRAVHMLDQVGSVSRDRTVWHQRFWSNSSRIAPVTRAATSAAGARAARKLDASPEVLLQLSNWLDLRGRGLRPRLRCTYQDGNLARFLTRPDFVLDPTDRWVRRTLAYERKVQHSVDLVFTFSEWLRRSMIDDLGVAPENVVTIGAGANLRRLPDASPRDYGRARILFVGRNFDRKGGNDLLAAFRIVSDRHPEAELWIVGPSEPISADPMVRNFGHLSPSSDADAATLDRLYREASVFAMPSLYEPWGNVWLEAMSYRLPCVGTATCAMPEIILEGETGYTVPVHDVAALAERLLLLIEDPDLARRLGEAGRERVASRYTWDAVAGRMTDAIQQRLPTS
jgi:glycosyltransferase involved in cell wall biosynthesis